MNAPWTPGLGPRVMLLGVVASFALVGFSGCDRGASAAAAKADNTEKKPVAVRVAEVRTEQRPVALVLDGTLLADEQSEVTSVVPGRVMAVLVERGSVVKKGDPLVRLRDVDYRLAAKAARLQLEQARARLGMGDEKAKAPKPADLPDVASAKTAMELASRNEERAVELARRGVLPPASLDETRTRAAAAREQYQLALNNARASISALESARVALAQASTSAAEAVVRAPFGGEVANRMVSVGEFVAPQTPLITLVRTDPLRIELSVPQQHLSSVQAGQTVHLTVDALPDRTFEATVRYVSAAVQRDTRSLAVEAVVPNPERLLRPGLFAAARLETGGDETVAVVPSSAVHTAVGVSRVFVVQGDKIEERVVAVADRTGDVVVVTEGLSKGEKVAVGNLEQLSDGMAVTTAAAIAQTES